jgi:hypothetical protein
MAVHRICYFEKGPNKNYCLWEAAMFIDNKKGIVQANYSKTDKKNSHDKKRLWINACGFILIGIIFFFVKIILELNIECGQLIDNKFLFILRKILDDMGIVLLAVGIGTIGLEFFGYIKYAKSRIEEVILEYDYLAKLKGEELQNLKYKLDKLIYSPQGILPKDSFFYEVRENIDSLLNFPFYKEYIVSVYCSIEGGYIKKRIYKQMVLTQLNPTKVQKVDNIVTIWFSNCGDLQDNELFSINRVVLKNGNKQDIDLKERVKCENIPDDENKKKVYVNCEDLIFTDDIMLEIEYTTKVPIDDKQYIHRVDKPCQHYCIHFDYDPNLIKIDYAHFCFMESRRFEKESIRTRPNGLVIRFNGWILPGDGTIFNITKI